LLAAIAPAPREPDQHLPLDLEGRRRFEQDPVSLQSSTWRLTGYGVFGTPAEFRMDRPVEFLLGNDEPVRSLEQVVVLPFAVLVVRLTAFHVRCLPGQCALCCATCQELKLHIKEFKDLAPRRRPVPFLRAPFLVLRFCHKAPGVAMKLE
jgi:hypothetical protein